MRAPIDATNGEAQSKVDSNNDQGAADITADFATDCYPRTEETKDCARYTD